MRQTATDNPPIDARGRLVRFATPIGLGLVLAAPFLSPFRTAAAAALATGIIVLAALAALAIATGARLSGYRLRAVIAAACASSVMVLPAALAPDPWVSALGVVGQRAGALTWLVALGLFLVGIVERRRMSALLIAQVIAAGSALYAVVAILQAAGILSSLIGVWGSASGPLENSSSLGSLLVLGAGASAAAWSAAESRAQRIGWIGAGVSCTAGIAAASSAGAVVGLCAGVVVAVALQGVRSSRKRIDWAAPAAVIAVLLGVAGAVSVASGLAGRSALATADALSNLRFTLWRSAAYALRADPLVGRGPDQFTAWAQWSLSPTAGLQTQAAHDPHNLVLASAIAAGIPGLLIGSTALAWLGMTGLAHWQTGGRPRAIALSIAALAGWSTTLLFTWASPPSLFCAAALAGGCISALSHRETQRTPRTRLLPTIAVGAGVLLLLALAMPSLFTEFRFAAQMGRTADSALSASITAMESDPHDPAYANAALAELLKRASGGDTDALNAARLILAPRVRDAAWNVDLAANLLTIAPSYPPDEARKRISEAVTLGHEADGASGLWDSLAAQASVQVGDSSGAQRFAREALRHPDVNGALRSELRTLAKGD